MVFVCHFDEGDPSNSEQAKQITIAERHTVCKFLVRFLLRRNDKILKTKKHLIKPKALALIEVKILFIFSLKIKRLQRIAGLAPKKINHEK
ncbi:hypothetical protein DBR27_19590 [Flavobacterium sp. HMWF030]|nr:hypothetical protein DBR27_19590 [Flavobacterium sp. HMWF030]